jgi:hypothetical protein
MDGGEGPNLLYFQFPEFQNRVQKKQKTQKEVSKPIEVLHRRGYEERQIKAVKGSAFTCFCVVLIHSKQSRIMPQR